MQSQIVVPQMEPRFVTLSELRAKLLPYCFGYKWAEDAIVDLWKKGAPLPVAPGMPETRVLLPKQFAKWWEDVAQRMGYEEQSIYSNLASTMKSSVGETHKLRNARG